ncbi:MAG: hypothetical protein R2844_20610 [Caldilineales bacterium]
MIGILFGLALTFLGYRMFLILLPIWGFFFGLIFGAQAVQTIFGDAFLATVTSWVIGFIAGAFFAVLSYLFFAFAVAVIAFSLGYSVIAGIWAALGLNFNLIAWVLAVAAGVVMIFLTLRFRLAKLVIEIGTAILGAGAVFTSILLMFVPATRVMESPLRAAMDQSVLLVILFVVLAVVGFVYQYRVNKMWEIDSYNRWEVSQT